MEIEKTKTVIGGLVSKLSTIDEEDYDKSRTFEEFARPFFETLGWDFETDVKEPDSITENKADYAFQIDGVSRFYLSVVPPSKSLEDRKQILPLTGFAYNKGVTWAILTNFKETRVYNTEAPGTSPRAMQHYSFSSSEYISKFEELLNLTKKQFSLNVLDSDAEYFGKKPKRVPIDQQLLKDLLSYRDMLVDDITKNNSITEEEAEQIVQKILNRLIFIRSCGDRQIEDRHLKSSLGDWKNNKNKKLVEYLREIFAYFRGRYGSSLFEKHTSDNLIISDPVLEEIIEGLYHSKEKSFLSYDFSLISSDVLGKMYENYLGTIQRKQDGAYYTPNYISKYIAENTIIPYLSKSNVTNIPDLISEYADNIKELESKIHNIKILDPACGTGEFLIRAIDVLLKISSAIQNHKEKSGKYSHVGKKKKSESTTYATFDKEIEGQEVRTIIQNNIFGLDINEEAIEITQLNLFLKLATSNKQLPDVSKNLRVGNALIDDKSVDPKAFDWKQAFPEKFDIVIGNPPYAKEMDNRGIFEPIIKSDFNKYHQGKMDYWYFFVHRSIDVLKDGGRFGFITNSYWYKNSGATKMIERIRDNLILEKCIDFGKIKVFKDVQDKHMIHLYRKDKKSSKDRTTYIKLNKNDFKNVILEKTKTVKPYLELFTPDLKIDFITDKIDFRNCIPLGDIYDSSTGVQESTDKITKDKLKQVDSDKFQQGAGVFVLSESEIKSLSFNKQEKEIIRKYLDSNDVRRYSINFKNEYLIYSDKEVREKIAKGKYPNIKKHLDNVSQFITSVNKPYGLHRARTESYFAGPKLICKGMFSSPQFCYDEDKYFVGFSFSVIFQKDSNYDLKYLLGLLNSRMGWYWFSRFGKHRGGGVDIGVMTYRRFPIFNASPSQQQQIISLVEKLMENYKKKTDEELDEAIYALYKFTEEEKKIIESSV